MTTTDADSYLQSKIVDEGKQNFNRAQDIGGGLLGNTNREIGQNLKQELLGIGEELVVVQTEGALGQNVMDSMFNKNTAPFGLTGQMLGDFDGMGTDVQLSNLTVEARNNKPSSLKASETKDGDGKGNQH
jgi:hypothetical protein